MGERVGPTSQGAGIRFPDRKAEHADPEWYQRDLDDPFVDPDAPDPPDPLPTARYRRLPDPPEE